ncbi:MAG: hypothetical protein FWC83_00620 [Alphaproteobacteria bacterium]|nr:hypothetical protein [Alphaproteobacteria bacterium]
MPVKKPVKRTTNHEPRTTTLSTWLFRRPVKYALFSLGLIICAMVLSTVATFLTHDYMLSMLVFSVSSLAAAVFMIFYAIRTAGDVLLSRRDMLYINIGITLTMIGAIAAILIPVMFFSMANLVSWHYMMMAMYPSLYMTLLLLIMVFIFFAVSFFKGLIVYQFIAIYKYARANNVPKWKVLLSLPAGTGFLSWPSYIAESNSKTADSVSNKAKWFEVFIQNILKNHVMGWVVLAAIVIPMNIMNMIDLATVIVMMASLGAVQYFFGLKKLTTQMPSIISTLAIIFNVIIIATAFSVYNAEMQRIQEMNAQIEVIEIMEIQ